MLLSQYSTCNQATTTSQKVRRRWKPFDSCHLRALVSRPVSRSVTHLIRLQRAVVKIGRSLGSDDLPFARSDDVYQRRDVVLYLCHISFDVECSSAGRRPRHVQVDGQRKSQRWMFQAGKLPPSVSPPRFLDILRPRVGWRDDAESCGINLSNKPKRDEVQGLRHSPARVTRKRPHAASSGGRLSIHVWHRISSTV